jgi:hypothetical protein
MEDRGPVSGGPDGRFVGHEASGRDDSRARDGTRRGPLVLADRTRGGHRGGPRDAARAAGARTRRGTSGTLLIRAFPLGAIREDRGRAAGDQVVEPVESQQPVRLRGDQVVATGPGRTRRGETLDHEQRQRRCAPSRQSFKAIGPHHNPAIERCPGQTCRAILRVMLGEMANGAYVGPIVATITYPTATSHFKDVRENRGSKVTVHESMVTKVRSGTEGWSCFPAASFDPTGARKPHRAGRDLSRCMIGLCVMSKQLIEYDALDGPRPEP